LPVTDAKHPSQHRLPPLLRALLDVPVGTEECVVPVVLLFKSPLMRKVALAALVAAVEIVVAQTLKGKGKPR
jgi:hypothetical protein